MSVRRTSVLLAVVVTSGLLPGQQNYPPQYGYPQTPQQGYPPQQQQAPPVQDPNGAPDQPGQPVARLGAINGEASVRRGDSGEWVAAALNAPLMAGDSLSVGPNGSAELQLDYGNFVRISGETEIRISALENGRNQIQIARGLITYRVLRDSTTQSEISTPAVSVRPVHASAVRVEVAPDGSTRVIVRHGDADISTPKGTEHVHEGNMMMVRGSPDDPEYQIVYAPARDGWDNWSDQRDAYIEGAQSNRYMSQDIQGGQDLDAAGRWGYDPAYGNVWTPNVPAAWAPYSNGQWVWEDYYGWTWVDYDPWGWAPFHYGSWYFRTGFGWSWFPGSRYAHYWWRPAMVGFFGFGGGVGFGFGNVGWVPLAPFEAFHPWYGRGWYGGGGVPVAGRVGVVNNVNIYNTYRNARFGNGVTAVSAQDFQRGVFRNQIAVNRTQLQQASLVRGAVPITPSASNLRFSERAVSTATPRSEITNQRFFSRMQPSGAASARVPFAQQQAAARSAFGGQAPVQSYGGYRGGSAPAQQGEWEHFGGPGTRSLTSPQQRVAPNGGWNGFGGPQPAPQRSAPAYSGRPAYGGGGSRAAPTPSYRSAPAPSGNRAGGGGHPSSSHGSRR